MPPIQKSPFMEGHKANAMTYNFDSEKWYDMERRELDRCLADEELDRQAYGKELDALDRKYEAMLDCIDGNHEIPK